MKILVIALSGIGDALMFTPALKELRHHYPDSEIDALVMYKGVQDIYSRLEEVNNVLFFDYLKASKISSFLFTTGLRKNKYDLSINVYPSNRKEYNIINFLIGARKRAAVNYLRGGFSNFSFLNNILVKEDDSLHNVEENCAIVEAVTGTKTIKPGPMLFPLKYEEEEYAEKFLEKESIHSKDLVIGFHPGCATLKNHSRRRWELEKFAELGKLLISEHKAKLLIFGGPDELELKETISYKISSDKVFTVNANSLAETAALMKRCSVFVTNDSSLMHVAASLRLNTVAIIGPTNTNYIRPWQTNHKIASLNLDCAPCFYYSPKPLTCSRNDKKFKCIKNLDVMAVYTGVKDFLYDYYGFKKNS